MCITIVQVCGAIRGIICVIFGANDKASEMIAISDNAVKNAGMWKYKRL